jgi:hypothetical protein
MRRLIYIATALMWALPAQADFLRAHERKFVETEMTALAIANNCEGYEGITGGLSRLAAEMKVRHEVVEAVHEVLQVAIGADTAYSNRTLMQQLAPVMFSALDATRDKLKESGACESLSADAVRRGLLRRTTQQPCPKPNSSQPYSSILCQSGLTSAPLVPHAL